MDIIWSIFDFFITPLIAVVIGEKPLSAAEFFSPLFLLRYDYRLIALC